MKRTLLIGMVSCFLVMGLHAETIRVMRFVPVAGSESEVAQNSLQKVVFTRDSIVLISALDGEATPMYKYDYQAILFDESSKAERLDEVKSKESRVKSCPWSMTSIRVREHHYSVGLMNCFNIV